MGMVYVKTNQSAEAPLSRRRDFSVPFSKRGSHSSRKGGLETAAPCSYAKLTTDGRDYDPPPNGARRAIEQLSFLRPARPCLRGHPVDLESGRAKNLRDSTFQYEALATPLTYLVVNKLKRAEGVDVYDRDTNFNPFARNSENRAAK